MSNASTDLHCFKQSRLESRIKLDVGIRRFGLDRGHHGTSTHELFPTNSQSRRLADDF